MFRILTGSDYDEVMYLQPSKLCRYLICPKMSKIELFNRLDFSQNTEGSKQAMYMGSWLHKMYYEKNGNTVNNLLLKEIRKHYGKVLQKQILIERIKVILRGKFDNLEINPVLGTVSVVEGKTTGKGRLTTRELSAALFQLQIYLFILKPILNNLGWELDKYHYLEIYDQNTYTMMKRIEVEEDMETEEMIKEIVKSFLGLSPMMLPPSYICKRCPRQVKSICGRTSK